MEPRSTPAGAKVRRPRLLAGLKHRRHSLVDEIDCFQRPEHDLELDDLARRVPFDQIDSVDEYSIDLGFEFEHGVRRSDDLPDVAKAWIEEHVERCAQVPGRKLSAVLRRVNYRRVEDRIFCEQGIQPGGIVSANKPMPGFKSVTGHCAPLVVLCRFYLPIPGAADHFARPRKISRRLLGASGEKKSGIVPGVRFGLLRNSTGHSVMRSSFP